MFLSTRSFILLCTLFVCNSLLAQNPNLIQDPPPDHFINEEFCFPVSIENTGANPGYGPYIRLVLPPGVNFTGSTYLGIPVTGTTVGVFAGSPLADPQLNTGTALDSVSGPVGYTLIILELPVGSITTGGATLNLETCFLMDPNQVNVGTPQDISMTTVYQFGDTPTGSNGPIIGPEVVSSVTPTLYTYEKYSNAALGDRSPGPSWPVQYTLEVDIADGMTITNLDFNDILPPTLQWTGTPVTASGGCTVNQSPNLAPTTGGSIQVTCPNATGALGGGDVTVVFEAYVIDTLDETIGNSGDCDTEPIINASTFNSTEGILETDNDTVTAYNITMQHGASPTLTNPGATITYTIDYQVSDYITAVDSFVITVITADGLTYLGNATINGNPIVANSILVNTPGTGQTTVTYFVTSEIGPLSPGDGGTLTYQCQVDQNYSSTGAPILTRDNLSNGGVIDYHLTDEAPGLAGCSYPDAAGISISPITLSKSIPSGTTVYVPGDFVTYRLNMTIPSGDADGVELVDFLPLPIHDVTDINLTWNGPDIVVTGAHNVPNVPTVTANPATNGLTLNFGNISTTSPPSIVEVDISVPVTTIPFANGLNHSNILAGETNNTAVDGLVDENLTLITVGAPILTMTKGVSATDNPNANIVPAPATPIDGNATGNDGSDQITFVASIENNGDARAYDVKFADNPPAGFSSCNLVSVTQGNGSPFPYTPSGTLFTSPTDTLFLDSLEATGAAGQANIALITYQCLIDPAAGFGLEMENTAAASWTSAPGQASAFSPVSDLSTVTLETPSVTKSIFGISPGYQGNLTDVHVGEIIQYEVQIDIPEGVVQNANIVDLLDEGLAFVEIDTVFADADVSTSVGTFLDVANNVVFSAIGGGATADDRSATFDLGTLSNTNPDNNTLESITLRYSVRVLNAIGNVNGQTLNNNCAINWDDPNGGGTLSENGSAPDVTIREADLEVTKVFLTNDVQRGDEVFVTLSFAHTGNSAATAFDVVVSDTLPLGLNFIASSITTTCPTIFSSGPSQSGSVVSGVIDSLPQGQSCDITFKVSVDNAVPECDTISNCGYINWESLYDPDQLALGSPPTNALGEERTGDLNDPGAINNYSFENCTGLNVINGLAVDPVITSNSPICVGGTATLEVPPYTGQVVNYEWFGPNGNPIANNSFQLTISPVTLADSGSYVIVVSVDGCASDTSQAHLLTIAPSPSVNPANNGMVCSPNGTALNLSANPSGGVAPYTFNWTGPNGFASNVQDPVLPNANAGQSGYYSVFVTDSNGCTSAQNSTLVEITTQPNIPIISFNSPVCEGEMVNFSTTSYGGSSVSYTWIGPGVPPNTTSNSFSINPATVADGGNYQVLVSVDGCDSDTSSIATLIVNPLPGVPNPSFNSPLCGGDSLFLVANPPAVGPFSFVWTGPDGFTSTLENPSIPNPSPSNSGSYVVEITSAAGCSNSNSVQVSVSPATATPSITSGGGSVCVGDPFTFTANSFTGSSVSYIWTLPNGTFDTTSTPQLAILSATVTDSGSYSLTVLVDGCSSLPSASEILNVDQAPSITGGGGGPACEGETIQLTSTLNGSTASGVSWSGPNGFSSNQANPVVSGISLSSSGDYIVTAVNGACSTSDTVNISVNPTPATPVAQVNNAIICEGDTLILNSPSTGAVYSYTSPIGNVITGNPPLSVLPTDADYVSGDWTLTVTDGNGCSSPPSAPVNVMINPVPTAIPSNDGPICFNGSANLMGNAMAGATYEWFDADPNAGGVLIATSMNTTVGPLANGSFDYFLVVTQNGCPSDPVATTVTVDSVLAAPQVPADTALCEGGDIVLTTSTNADTYMWTGPNGFSSSAQNPPVISPAAPADAGDYIISVTVNGCGSASDTTTVTVNPTPATPVAQVNTAIICEGDTLILNSPSTGAVYSWTSPIGNVITGNPPLSVLPTDADYVSGDWTLTVTDGNGCSSPPSAPVNVMINPVPTAIPSNDGPICFNGSANLMGNAIAGATYEWFDADPNAGGVLIATSMSTTVGPLANGTFDYFLVVTQNGCPSDPVATTVTVDSVLAAPQVPADTALCEGGDIVLTTSTNADTYMWTGPNGFSSSAQNPPVISPAAPADAGDYILSVTVNGCGSASDTTTLTVNPTPATPVAQVNNAIICEGDTLILNSPSAGVIYSWTSPIGNVITGNPPLRVLPTDADYVTGDWTLTVTDANGCSSPPSAPVNVMINPVPTAIPSNDGPICFNGSANFMGNAIAGATYEWFDADPNAGGVLIATSMNTTVGPLANGSFDYFLVVIQNGCPSDPVATTVTVDSVLAAPQVPADTALCEGGDIVLTTSTNADTYMWTGPNGFSSSAQNPPVISPAAPADEGDYILSVTINGCGSASDTTTVTVNPTPATPVAQVNNAIICEGDTLILNSPSTGAVYSWTSPIGNVITGNPPLSVLPTDADYVTGDWTLTVTDANGCSSDASAPVNAMINPVPTAIPSNDGPICFNGSANLMGNAIAGATYEWFDADPNAGGVLIATSMNTTVGPLANGTFDYFLVVTQNGCPSDPVATTVTVDSVLAAPQVPADTALCEGGDIVLTTSTNADTYMWTGPNGFSSSAQNPPVISPAAPADEGDYILSVTINGCGSASDTTTVTVNPTPATPVAQVNNAIICEGDTLILNSPSTGAVYSWTSPIGNVITGNPPLSVLPTDADYVTGDWTLTVTDANGCSSPPSAPVNVMINPVPTAIPSNDGPICFNGSANLMGNAIAGATYEWFDADPNAGGVLIATSMNTTVGPLANGSFDYFLVVTQNGCPSDPVATTVTVDSVLVAPQVPADTALCEGGDIVLTTSTNADTYMWTGPNGFSSSAQNPPVISPAAPADAGDYILSVTINGCGSASDTTTVTVNPTPATPVAQVNNAIICEGDTLILNSPSAGVIYSWTSPIGNVITGNPPLSVLPTDADYVSGDWTLTVTDANGCSSPPSAPVNVMINPVPTAIPSNDGPICFNGSANLMGNAIAGATYEWFDADPNAGGVLIATSMNTTVGPLANGSFDYFLVVIQNGCPSDPVATTVTVDSVLAAPQVPADTALCEGGDIVLTTSTNADTYMWTGPNGFSSSAQNPPVISPAAPADAGDYILSVTINGCGSASDTTTVAVNPTPATPSIQANPNMLCDGDSIVLSTSASCDNFLWIGPGGNSSATLNNPLLNTTTNTTTIPPADSAYLAGDWSVVCVSADGCESAPSAPTTITINPIPVAFPTNDGPICFNGSVNLLGNSVPGGNYQWYDGDPNTGGTLIATSMNTTVGPLANGTFDYFLVLTVNGCPSLPVATTVTVDSILAAPQVPADFAVCEGGNIVLTTTTSADTYNWTGPNGFSSSLQNPMAIGPATTLDAGDYILSVTVNGCGSASDTVNVTVNPIPAMPTIAANATSICEGDTMVLTTSANCGNYLWIGPGGNSTSTLNNPLLNTNSNTTSIPPADSAYLSGPWSVVCVSADGCESAPSNSINVTIEPAPMSPSVSNNGPVCQGQDIQLQATSIAGASYFWTGPNGFTSTQQNPLLSNVTMGDTGNYAAFVMVNGCVSDTSIATNVQVSQPAVVTVADDTLLCSNGNTDLNLVPTISGGIAPYSFSWTGPNGFASTDSIPVIPNADSTDAGPYVLVLTDQAGCQSIPATGNLHITNGVATPVISGPPVLCEGDQLQLTSTNYQGDSVLFIWNLPGGSQSTVNPSYVINPVQLADSGDYAVIAYVDGCFSQPSNAINIEIEATPINPAPVAMYGNGSNCAGDTLFLSASGDPTHTYSWTGPNGFIASGQNVVLPNADTNANGSYSVTVTNGNCSANGAVTYNAITPYPAAPVIAGGGSFCEGDQVNLTSPSYNGSAVDYIWTTPNGMDTLASPGYAINPVTLADSGSYSLQVIVNGCPSLVSGSELVQVNAAPAVPVLILNANALCDGDTLTLGTPTMASGYIWTGPNGFTASVANPSAIAPVSVSNAGVYGLAVVENGCTSVVALDTVVVNASPASPTLQVAATTICETDSIELSTSGTCSNFLWVGPGGNSSSTLNNPLLNTTANNTVIPPLDSAYLQGNWSVICVSSDGCESAPSAPVAITIQSTPATPTANNGGPYCVGDQIDLFGNGLNPSTYVWSGPNGFTSNAQNPSVFNATAQDSGAFYLQVIENGCISDSAITVVEVNSPPVTPAPTSNGPVCAGFTLELYANTTATNYSWNGPNGYVSNLQNPIINSVSGAFSGTYFLTVTTNGCTSTAGIVNVTILGAVTTPNIANNGPLCEGEPLVLNSNSYNGTGVDYIWYGPGGVVLDTTSIPQYIDSTVTVIDAGFYQVVVEIAGCGSLPSILSQVEINPIPGQPTIISGDSICEGEDLIVTTLNQGDNFIWTGPDGFISNLQQPEVIENAQAINSGFYYLTIIEDGCISPTDSFLVTVNPSPAQPVLFADSLNLCAGDSLVLTTNDSGADDYTWIAPNGSSITTLDTVLVVFPITQGDSGSYQVVHNLNGCPSPASASVQVDVSSVPPDNAYAGEDRLICESEGPISLDAVNQFGGIWSTTSQATIISPTNEASIVVGLEAGQTYVFNWTIDNNACSSFSQDSVVITVALPPVALDDSLSLVAGTVLDGLFLTNNDTDFGLETVLTLTGPPDHGSVDFSSNAEGTYSPDVGFYGEDPFQYSLCFAACPDACDTANVYVEVEPDLVIPDLITPNGDGSNDAFVILGLENFPDHQLVIYNRWGNEVFDASPYQNDWRGTWDGNPLPEATYYYVFLNKSNGDVIAKGYITLHR